MSPEPSWFRALLSKVLGADIDLDEATVQRIFAKK